MHTAFLFALTCLASIAATMGMALWAERNSIPELLPSDQPYDKTRAHRGL